MNFLANIAKFFGGGFIKNIGEVVDKFVTTPQERSQMKQALKSLHQKHMEELIALANADRQSARKMQMAALGQEDRFSKRFVYYLAGFWSITGVAYVFFVTFMPMVHPRVADTILGFLMGTIVSTIINYFYGSSETKASTSSTLDEANKIIKLLPKKKSNNNA